MLLTDDPDGMVGAAAIIARWGAPAGDGIGIISSSGGGAGIGVDRVEESRLRLAKLSSPTRAALLELLLPPQADNPIDLGGRRGGESVEIAAEIMARFVRDDDIAVVFLVLTTVPFFAATARALAEAALASGKPFVVAITPGSAADSSRAALHEIGCPFFDRVDDAIRALQLFIAQRHPMRTVRDALPQRPSGLPDAAPTLPPGPLTEPQAKALLARYGVPLPRETFVATAEAAAAAAQSIGGPVALKAVARGLVHKSDAGGVRLGLPNAAAAADAFVAVVAAVSGCRAPFSRARSSPR